jgi:hypothetical protein
MKILEKRVEKNPWLSGFPTPSKGFKVFVCVVHKDKKFWFESPLFKQEEEIKATLWLPTFRAIEEACLEEMTYAFSAKGYDFWYDKEDYWAVVLLNTKRPKQGNYKLEYIAKMKDLSFHDIPEEFRDA